LRLCDTIRCGDSLYFFFFALAALASIDVADDDNVDVLLLLAHGECGG